MKRTALLVLLGIGVAMAAFAGPVEGQIWKKVKEKAKAKIEQKVEASTDSVVDKTYDTASGVVKCVVSDKACINKAQSAGQQVVVTNAQGQALPAEQQAAAVASATGQPAGEAVTEKAAPAMPKPGEGAWANYDFVPGERVLYREDFASERVGNFPRRLEFVSGNAEVVTWNGAKWLRVSAPSAFAVALPEVLPSRFTMEFQVTMPAHSMIMYAGPDGDAEYLGSAGRAHSVFYMDGGRAGFYRAGKEGTGSISDPRKALGVGVSADLTDRLLHVRVQGDGNYLKAYLEEERISNLPNGDFLRTNKIYFAITPDDGHPAMISDISINAGGTEMYEALMQDGRFATQGILFDVDSDRIRPESTPTLNEIVDMLKGHAELRIRIEGHTDNTGEAAHNQTLSEQRAASVKAYLASQGVDASRLESAGFGPTKPVKPNDTAEGRQANRRVELVKL